MNKDLQDFQQFMKQREDVARAYARGDAAPLARVVARVHPATFFSPKGGYRQGTEEVSTTYERDAAAFEPGGDSKLEILQMAASDGVACWAGFQRATVRMQGSAKEINLRVTEVFRREGDAWKLVHRHADTLVSESDGKTQ
jgi:ketosteroid isomerase-like protein